MNTFSNLPEIPDNSYLPVFVDISKDHLDFSIGWESSDSSIPAARIAYRSGRLEAWIQQLITDYC